MAAYAGFHSVSVRGRVDLTIRLGPDLEYSIVHADKAGEGVAGLSVHRQDGSVLIEAPEDLNQPGPPVEVAVTAPTLSKIGAFSGATVCVSGSADSLLFRAYQSARVDGSDLKLVEAEVDLETFSDVSIAASGEVTGSVAYGARLHLLFEPEHARIVTGNAGRVTGSEG